MACLLERCYPPVPPFAQRIAVPSRIQYPEYYADEPNHYPTRYGPGAATQLRQLEGNQGCPDGSDIRNIRDKVTALSYGEYLVDHDSNPAHDDYGHVVNRWGPRLAAGGVRGSPLPEGAMLAEESLLRELVAQCLCEKPFYRPSMAWLQAKIEEQIRKLYGKIDEDDEENEDNRKMREFVREIFDRPPPPSPPPVRGRRRKRNMKGKYPTEGQLARDRKEQKQKREEREAQRRVEEEVRDRQRQLDEEDEQDGAEDGEEN